MHRIDTKTAQKDKFGAGKNGFTPVSYTHLDVYKRQAQYVPMFTLTLDKKEITMPKNTVIFPFASDETAKYLNEQQQKYKDCLLYPSRCV